MIFKLAFLFILLGLASLDATAGNAKDKIPPSVSISLPVDGAVLCYLTPLYGWVKDDIGGSGIARVTVLIQRKNGSKTFYLDGYKWSLSAHKTASEFWFLAKLMGNRWRFDYVPDRSVSQDGHGTPYNGPSLLSGTYKFQITAYDRAGNKRSVSHSIRVNADTIRPRIAFFPFRQGRTYTQLHSVQGVARDKGGSGLTGVWYAITRQRDAKKWSSSAWINPYGPDGNPPIWLPAILSKGQWRLGRNLPTETALPSGLYHVQVRAIDRAGNLSDREFYGPRQNSTADAGDFHFYSSSIVVKIR